VSTVGTPDAKCRVTHAYLRLVYHAEIPCSDRSHSLIDDPATRPAAACRPRILKYCYMQSCMNAMVNFLTSSPARQLGIIATECRSAIPFLAS
jgi:hypothetical protein